MFKVVNEKTAKATATATTRCAMLRCGYDSGGGTSRLIKRHDKP